MNDAVADSTERPVGLAPAGFRQVLLLHGVFDAADGILNIAFDFLTLAVGDQLCVAQNLSRGCLDVTLDLFGRTGDPIFVNHVTSLRLLAPLIRPSPAGGQDGPAGVNRPLWPPGGFQLTDGSGDTRNSPRLREAGTVQEQSEWLT